MNKRKRDKYKNIVEKEEVEEKKKKKKERKKEDEAEYSRIVALGPFGPI